MNYSPPISAEPEISRSTLWKDWLRTHRVEVLLFILLWTTYAYFYQSIGTNEAVRFDQLRALVQEHRLAIDTYCYNSPDLIRYPKDTGHLYPNKAPGMTIVAVVPFSVLYILLRPLLAFGVPEWIYWHLLTYLITLLAVSLLSALAAVAIYRVLNRFSGDSYFSAWVVVAIWLGTLVFPYSTFFYSHVMAGSLLAIAFYLLIEVRFKDSPGRDRLIYCCAGVLIGLSVATEYPVILLGGILGIYAAWITWRSQGSTRGKARTFGMFLLGGAIGGGTLVAYNLIAFRNPFHIPYEAYATPGSSFYSTYAKGWMGMHWSGLSEFLSALASVLFNRPMGLLYVVVGRWYVYACNPVLWLGLPGFAIMIWSRRLRAEGLVVAAMVVVYLVFISNYGSSINDWGGGLYYGPRHLIPLLPFLALPLYFGADKLRPLFYPLAVVSIFYMLLCTAVEPRIAFPFGDIARDFLLPDYLYGQLAQNKASLFDPAHLPLTADSTAANLAKLAHIPGRFQLAPLMLWWLIVGTTLLFLVKQKRRRLWNTILLCVFVIGVVLAPPVHHAMTAPKATAHGLLAKYYRNAAWEGAPVDIEIDKNIDFDWSKGENAPYPAPFSVEWTGDLIVEREGFYEFALVADDGAVFEIDSRPLVDASHSVLEEKKESTSLGPGRHPIRVRYFNSAFGGSVKLSWTLVGRPRQVVPNEALIPEMTRRPSR